MNLKVDEVKHDQKDLDDDGWIEAGNTFDDEEYDDFEAYKFTEVKEELVGELKGSFEGDYENDGYIIELDEDTARIVWASSAQLKQKLPEVPQGAIVKIIYEGDTKTENNYPMKNYKVLYKETD